MKVTPLAADTPGLRDTLLAHGWDLAQATAAADGAESGAVHATELDSATVERLVLYAGGKLGLDVLTGADWAVISGSRARLSTLARPWGGPPELADIAHAVGLALPGVTPSTWTVADRSLPLDKPLLVGIINVTPDSFSDGCRYADLAVAADNGQQLVLGEIGTTHEHHPWENEPKKGMGPICAQHPPAVPANWTHPLLGLVG